jgi:hypothetical protein
MPENLNRFVRRRKRPDGPNISLRYTTPTPKPTRYRTAHGVYYALTSNSRPKPRVSDRRICPGHLAIASAPSLKTRVSRRPLRSRTTPTPEHPADGRDRARCNPPSARGTASPNEGRWPNHGPESVVHRSSRVLLSRHKRHRGARVLRAGRNTAIEPGGYRPDHADRRTTRPPGSAARSGRQPAAAPPGLLDTGRAAKARRRPASPHRPRPCGWKCRRARSRQESGPCRV